MGNVTGTFCFAELVSPDAEAAQQFYGDLFGWTAEDVSDTYSFFQIGDQVVAGLRSIPRGRQQWIPYVSVEKLDLTLGLAEELGARLGQTPFEVSGAARMATLRDPDGRSLGLWEARGRHGVDRQEQPGSLWWVEMLAHDVAEATRFYTTLFGWKVRETGFPHLKHAYSVYSIGRESVAGAVAIEQSWGRVPDRWQVLFAVTDLKRTIEQTHGLGGSDDLPPLAIPNVGTCASLLDDGQGLFFAIQPTNMPEPTARVD